VLTDTIYRMLAPLPAAQRQFARVVRKLPHRWRVVANRGQRLMVDPSGMSGFYRYYEREYDVPLFDFLDRIISRYRTVIDLGANIGVYTCYFAARVPEVIAFEPDPAPHASVQKNLALNNLQNVTLHDACVGADNGTVTFYSGNSANSGIGSILGGGGAAIERPLVRLDDVVSPGSGRVLMKMDIEGAEWAALLGATRLLTAPDAPVDILMEVHPEQLGQAGIALDDLRALLVELGYTVAGIGPHGPDPSTAAATPPQRFWWATRPSGNTA
jgi:FkbM family methyltransferase